MLRLIFIENNIAEKKIQTMLKATSQNGELKVFVTTK